MPTKRYAKRADANTFRARESHGSSGRCAFQHLDGPEHHDRCATHRRHQSGSKYVVPPAVVGICCERQATVDTREAIDTSDPEVCACPGCSRDRTCGERAHARPSRGTRSQRPQQRPRQRRHARARPRRHLRDRRVRPRRRLRDRSRGVRLQCIAARACSSMCS